MSEGLTASFARRFAAGPVIRAKGLRLPERSGITVLFGASGSGKTTLLRCLAGVERPDEGAIGFGAETWVDADQRLFLPPQRRNIGFVPQDYALFPHLSVQRNIAYGLRGLPEDENRSRVAEAIRWLGLGGLERRLPRELSGGQQQRAALARAVVRRPRLLLLDEPLSAIDGPTRQRLRGELRRLLNQLGIPTLLVTHDRVEALALGDHLVVMDGGETVQQGPVQEVFSRPASLAVAGILAVETIQPGRVTDVAEGMVTVAVQGTLLSALACDLPPDTRDVLVCIRAEDVVLSKGADAQSSPRNRLPAVVRALTHEGPLVRVDLDCGFPLMAVVTKRGCEELCLEEGGQVVALVKAPHIHLIPHAF